MLPQQLRLRRSSDFASIIRRGRKAARRTVVVYALPAEQSRLGVVVGRQVGSAVVRNLVKRRLRHCGRGLIEGSGFGVVVRALPSAGTAGSRMADDLASAWSEISGVPR